jgi:ribonuclease P protein component
MLARLHRFHGYGSVRRAYQHGQTARGPLISLRYSRRKPGQAYRVAVVVSRKVHKSAVIRNRIRRRVYEAVRQSQIVPAETDLIFTVFSDKVTELEAARLQAIVAELLGKAD